MTPKLKVAIRILKYLFVSLVLLFLLVVATVNLPFVHVLITQKINTIFSEKGIPVRAGKITLLLNGKVGLQHLEIITSATDTIVYAGKASFDIRLLPLLKKRVIVKNIKLENVVANIITDEQTGKLNIISLFSKTETDETLVVKDTTQTGVSWEIQVGKFDLQNIRFIYSDLPGGIYVKQSLKKAAIDFGTFSILQKQIDVKHLEIEKPEGFISITTSKKDTTDSNSPAQPWKFSLKDFETNDLHFVLDQPESGQRMEFALKNGNISMENLDLNTREILVSEIKLVKPEIVFYQSDSVESITEVHETAEFKIPVFSWSVLAEKIDIKDGIFQYKNTDAEIIQSQQQWLPVNEFNMKLTDIRLSPAGYSLNLEKLSFNLNNLVEVKSGEIYFETDTLQNAKLKVELSASILQKKQSLFTKDKDISFSTVFSGSPDSLKIEKLNLTSTSGLDFSMAGYLTNILQMQQSTCNLNFRLKSVNRNQVKELASLFSPNIELPNFRPITLSGSVKNKLLNPNFNFNLRSGSGNISLTGNFDTKKLNGSLQASYSEILLSEIMGEVYPEKITGKLQINGGLNRSKMPEGEAFIEIDSVRYKNKTTRNIALHAAVQNNEAEFTVMAMDSALDCNFEGSFDWNNQKDYSGTLKGNFDIDLFGLNLISEPFSGKANIDASFGYAPDKISASLNMPDFTIRNSNDTVTLGKTEFNLTGTDSIIESKFKSDFLIADFKSLASFADFKNAFDSIKVETIINLDSTNFINLDTYSNLKFFSLDATVKDNQVFNLFFPDTVLNFSDIKINATKADINTRLEATVSTAWINYNKIKIFNPGLLARIENDRLKFQVNTDSIQSGEIKFGKSGIELDVLPASILGKLEVTDDNDSILHQIGFEAKKVDELVTLKSATPEWIIDKNPWTLSPPEFLTWEKSTKTLTTSLDMHWNDKYIAVKGKNTEMIHLDIKNLELNNLAIPGLIGFVPDGIIDANIKYSQINNDNIELNMEMRRMKWGDIYFNKLSANGHLIADSTGITDSEITLNADDSLSLMVEMTTNSSKKEYHVKSQFNKLQFQLFEPFISEYANQLHGTSSGEVNISIVNDKPALDGEIRFNDFGLKIIPLKAWLTIPDNKIEIKQNQFTFNNFTVIDSLNRPLTVNGKIGFENSDNIWADLIVKADKILLMNTSEKDNPEFFGSIVVNSGLNISGSVFSPEIKGNIDLESGTNLTYQLVQDLSVEGSQTDIVFATITDSLQIIYPNNEKEKRVTRMPRIETVISINPKSVFNVKISELYDVDISIAGDGLLSYNMLPNNTMSLNGVYEIKTGNCKLKITGWPQKDFKITPGSSFRWNGSVENPELNLEATTRVKGSYLNPIDNKSRAVDFVVSMQLKNQLSDLAIVFAIQSADQYITSVLSSLSADEIMRQAVNLLLFETIDLPGIESSGNYMAAQISSFWESQLNSLTKTTFNKTAISFGIDTYNQSTSSGQKETTSFTYEMERKFMNDRATVKLSGKLNDYNEGSYQTNSIFENFIFEYALDNHDSKYLKLYQKKDYQDMLEGEVIKYGAGFLYRKNYNRLKDIWQRGKNTKSNKTTKE